MIEQAEINPEKLLNKLRGNGLICGCGKILSKFSWIDQNGKQMHGQQHETIEDDEYHSAYFAGIGLK